jgi:uncharacterized membrane protein
MTWLPMHSWHPVLVHLPLVACYSPRSLIC